LINLPRKNQTAIYRASALCALLALMSGCGFQEYIAKPLNTAEIAEKFARRQVDHQQFHDYLLANGYNPAQIPIQQWGADELVYCALFITDCP